MSNAQGELARFEVDGEVLGKGGKSIHCLDGGFLFSSQCDTEAAALKDVDLGPVRVVVTVYRRDG